VRAIRAFTTGVGAVGSKELRGRMRGRRAFVVLTVYLLLLSGIAFGIYAYLRQQSAIDSQRLMSQGVLNGVADMALSADIGHAIFSGLLLLLTLLVLVLSPAFTTGAISMEREKQTIDLLVTTPLSTLGMVIGKLASALTYVFLLILASVPVMSVVFVFGGVGPEDLLRAYALLFAAAFGMGAIGLFISALVRRTQTATVITLIVVLGVTFGSAAVHELWRVLATQTPSTQTGFVPVTKSGQAPSALLWLNPFVGGMDLICTTAPGGYDPDTCDYIAQVTGRPFFSVSNPNDCPDGGPCARPVALDDNMGGALLKVFDGGDVAVAVAAPGVVPPAADVFVADDVVPGQPQALPSFGFPRDTLWPQIALSYVVLGLVLTILAAQLVAPTRRWRLRRGTPPAGGAWGTAPAVPASDGGSTPAATVAAASPDDPQTPDEVAS
jgi:ABC-type transport system involved in multi-copper enzyme maturation permease subunit